MTGISGQRRWADVVQMLYKCFRFDGQWYQWKGQGLGACFLRGPFHKLLLMGAFP